MMQAPIKKRGRPAAFDYDHALQNAMQVFWRHGYEGTAMRTLMDAMQMNKASIYAAYGDKQSLFNKAIECYLAGPASFIKEALTQASAIDMVAQLLTQAAQVLTDDTHPPGCLITQGALSCSAEAEAVKQQLGGYRRALESQLAVRFAQAQATHEISASADPHALAKLVMTLHQGMVVQANHGASTAALLQIAEMAVQWFRQAYTASGPAPAESVSAQATTHPAQ